MTDIFIDSADIKEIQKAFKYPFISGVTTNPKLISKALGKEVLKREDFFSYILKIRELFQGKLFIQTNFYETEKIVKESIEIYKFLEEDCIIKIPATLEGIKAIYHLAEEGVETAATAVFNGIQAHFASCGGASYVIPYFSRVTRSLRSGIDLIFEIANVIDPSTTSILVASVKERADVLELLKIEVSALTLPLNLIESLLDSPDTEKASLEFQKALKIDS